MEDATRHLGVNELRTCFFWPLTLCRTRQGSLQRSDLELVQEQCKRLLAHVGPWRKVPDRLMHLRPRDASGMLLDDGGRRAYAEYIYFHDFVQRAIFGTDAAPNDTNPMLLLERTDVRELTCTFYEKEGCPDWSLRFTVERLNLYILGTGVAVLALQVALKQDPERLASLEVAMKFNERMRRSHVPYFFGDGRVGGGLPHTVIWTMDKAAEAEEGAKGDPVFILADEGATKTSLAKAHPDPTISEPAKIAEGLLRRSAVSRQVLPLPHWQWLLNGQHTTAEIEPMPLSRDNPGGWYWRHFSDDRLPILSTIILPDRRAYYALQEGDWMRLAFVDGPGRDPYPYAPAFMTRTFPQHCYDRFHHDEGAQADAPVRYLMCDYAMTAVTYEPGNSFAADLSVHMQRHYYQMFLLAIIDKAMMLGLSSRISQAVEEFDLARQDPVGTADRETDLSEAMQEIERDFLHYVHRFRFTGISGQLQAVEMFAQLRGVMRLDELFDDIRTELETAVNFLAAREAQHATEAAERLNIIATLGIVIALVMGFFSMNLLTSETLLFGGGDNATARPVGHDLAWFLGGLALACLGASALQRYASARISSRGRTPRRSERLVQDVLLWLGFGSLMAVALSLVAPF